MADVAPIYLHYAYAWAPDADRWRNLIRYVLPTIRHSTIPELSVGVASTQPGWIYQATPGDVVMTDSRRREKEKERKRAGRVKKRAAKTGWHTVKWREE